MFNTASPEMSFSTVAEDMHAAAAESYFGELSEVAAETQTATLADEIAEMHAHATADLSRHWRAARVANFDPNDDISLD